MSVLVQVMRLLAQVHKQAAEGIDSSEGSAEVLLRGEMVFEFI